MNPQETIDQDKAFWDAHGRVGLVWSNPNASDDVLIANALLSQPNFHLLLDIASHFGFNRLSKQWKTLETAIEKRQFPEEMRKLKQARPIVERCLNSMQEAMDSTT